MKIIRHNQALKISLSYMLIGFLWILFSDQLVSVMFQSIEMIKIVSVAKGWLYVIVTGLFLYFFSKAQFSRILIRNSELEEHVRERTERLTSTNEYLEQTMAELEESQAELEELNAELEDNQDKLRILNADLEQSLENLKETQEQLIISEKLTALGELVAGVAHEINTPLGVGVTLASHMSQLHRDIKKRFSNDSLHRSDLEEFLDNSEEELELLNVNLERAASLVASFKQVAVDQSSQELRKFKIYDTIQDVLKSLYPKLKKTPFQLSFSCPEELEVSSYPGAISQIITNFVMNSLIHGFSDRSEGNIQIKVEALDDKIVLFYEDDGRGIPEELLTKVFNPFFSTNKHGGSTGLGLHIVHNLVTQTLNGHISLRSKENQGCQFKIIFESIYEVL